MLTKSAVGVVLLILLGYGAMEAWPLIKGPTLTLTSPTPGAVSEDGIVSVSGVAERITALTLNGAQVLPDEQGHFSRLIVLPRGGAILEATASDRFGRTITKQVSVYVP